MRWDSKQIKLVPEGEEVLVFLSAAFEHWRRGWGWRAPQSWPAFCWTGKCQSPAVSLLACYISNFSFGTNEIFLHSLLCIVRYKQCNSTRSSATKFFFWWRWAREEGPNLNMVFTNCNKQILLTLPLSVFTQKFLSCTVGRSWAASSMWNIMQIINVQISRHRQIWISNSKLSSIHCANTTSCM